MNYKKMGLWLETELNKYYNGHMSRNEENSLEIMFRIGSRILFFERNTDRQFPIKERIQNFVKKYNLTFK